MAPDATSSAAPTIPNQDRRGCDVPSWLPIPVTTCSRYRWFKILYNRTDALSLRVLVVAGPPGGRARDDAGARVPPRRAGAGARAPDTTPKGVAAGPGAAAPAAAGAGGAGGRKRTQ